MTALRRSSRDAPRATKPCTAEDQPGSAILHGLRLVISRQDREIEGLRRELARAYARTQTNSQRAES
jgi:hypothetical protein